MAVLDPYVLATILVVILMIVLAFIARGPTRVALLLFPLSLAGVMAFFSIELGLVGFQVGWFLYFPYLFAFCGFVLGFRSTRARKLGFLIFAFLVSFATLTLDVQYLLPQIVQGDRIQVLKGVAKFIYLSAEVLILLSSGLIALVVAVIYALVMWLAKQDD